MNTVKILHCADIHIGAAQSFLGTLAEKRRYEVLMTFERIIDMAKENDVKIIAIAGDLFDFVFLYTKRKRRKTKSKQETN